MPDLTVADVANALQLDEETVRRLARRHELKGYLVGGRWRFRPTELERFRVASTPVAESEPMSTRQLERSPAKPTRLPGWDKFVRRRATH